MALGEFLSGLGRGIQSGGRTFQIAREAQRDRERQERLDRFAEEDRKFERERAQKLLDLALAREAVETIEPDSQEVDPETAALIEGTPLRGRLRRQETLPSRQIGPGGITESPARESVTVRPTFEQSVARTSFRRQNEQQDARDATIAELEKSGDPGDQRLAQALRAGLPELPLPFDEQKRRARELGQIENDFALGRINAQLGGMSKDELRFSQAFQQIFTSLVRSNEDILTDPELLNQAIETARTAAASSMGRPQVGVPDALRPPAEEASAPPDVLGGEAGPGFGQRLRGAASAIGDAIGDSFTTFLPGFCPPGTPPGVICSRDGRKKVARR